MIVRNEALVIERCLASVADHIDTWVICDTGSTDDTVARIERALDGIPGVVHHHAWRDFGHNRSELMRVAAGSADYLLLLDADMTMRFDAPLPDLDADSYLIRHAGDLLYANPRLVRGDRRWWFSHPTHEYLATEGEFRQELLPDVWIEHHGDGGSRSDKFERDRDLLERYLKEHPDDPRATFYLANTYADLDDIDKAIEFYARRAELGAYYEEVFYSLYRQGALLVDRDFDAAVPILRRASEFVPTRSEPIHELARAYRFREEYEDAHRYASIARQIPIPETGLFVQRWIYEWGAEFEYSIAAFWVGELQGALDSCVRLLDELEIPAYPAPWVRRNLDITREALGMPRLYSDDRDYIEEEIAEPALTALVPSARMAEIKLDIRPWWPQTNPSITADDDGFRMVVRSVNYLQSEGQRYTVLERDDVVRTINYLVEIDDVLGFRDVAAVDTSAVDHQRIPTMIQGFEDCRLIQTNDGWVAIATVRDFNDASRNEMVLLRLDAHRVTSVTILEPHIPGRTEKNWMPFVVDGRLHLVYSCGPTIVLRHGPDGRIEERFVQVAPVDVGDMRGGSQGIEWDDGWLFVVHTSDWVGWSRVYTHRFVVIDRAFRLTQWSQPFRLAGELIEFCAGLARAGDDLVLSLGVEDRQAFLMRVPEVAVRDLLEPVDARRTVPA